MLLIKSDIRSVLNWFKLRHPPGSEAYKLYEDLEKLYNK